MDRQANAKEAIAIVESVKAASDIYAPVKGTVVEVNKALEADPGLINARTVRPRLDFCFEDRQRRRAKAIERCGSVSQANRNSGYWPPERNSFTRSKTVLIKSARMMVLNPKASTLCRSASRRIRREVICTSETWQVMPITNESRQNRSNPASVLQGKGVRQHVAFRLVDRYRHKNAWA